MDCDDNEQVKRAKAGDRQAFSELVLRHHAMVRGFLARFVANSDDVFDLAQEVFVTAYQKLARFDESRDFAAWLRGIARNLCMHYIRAAQRKQIRAPKTAETIILRWQEARLAAEDNAGDIRIPHLRECVEKLKASREPWYRMLQLRYFHNLSTQEIGAQVGRKEGAVRTSLLRIRQTLRTCVERAMQQEAASNAEAV
ncbi:MAG: sigma-70 family RNA polymerase sigma factor [Kiritimatiellae bacterium]|nr:sigma-70 family RNA polymerase sigma factor [Kiritimatiellia bacterium]